jgi:triacylglycerol esterase/lipase EstA (alpha/beta hydrolase family)
MRPNIIINAVLAATLAAAGPVVKRAAHNDYSCRSETNPNPVVLLHGLGATYYEDINILESYLQTQGFCTFSLTYGDYPGFPFVGGLKPIKESAVEIANFVKSVKQKTGAAKIDLVGHSEGAFQTLYVTKFGGVKDIIQRVFAIAPPTHGTTFLSLYNVTDISPALTRAVVTTILKTFGCPACANLLPNGDAVAELTSGPIAQEGVSYTILTSTNDQLVKPTTTSFVYEDGVRNLYVQDFCPLDPVGHLGEAYDQNVMELVRNALRDDLAGPEVCVLGFPGK